MKRIFIIGLTALLFGGGLSAQDNIKKWSLQECIDYAKEHNLDLQTQQVNIKQQEVTLSTAKNKRLPNLSAGASHSYSYGRSLGSDNTYQDNNTRTSSISLSTSVPIFSGFLINNQIAAEKLNLQAIVAELEKMKENMEINVTSAYLEVLYYKEILNVANDQLNLSHDQLDRTKKMFDQGRASESQIYEVEAQVASDTLSVVQAESNLQISTLTLTQLLELPSPEGFYVEEPTTETEYVLVRKPDAIYEAALTSRASIRAEELRLKSSEKNIKIAQSAYYPTLSFNAGYGTNYYYINGFNNQSFSDQFKNNRNEYFGLNLSIPIFNRFATRNSVRSAKFSKRAQEIQLENTKKMLYKDIQQAYYNAFAAGEKYKSSEKAYESAQKSFSYMNEKFDTGRATVYEYNESKTKMTKALSERTQAKYEFMLRKKILEFYERQ